MHVDKPQSLWEDDEAELELFGSEALKAKNTCGETWRFGSGVALLHLARGAGEA